MNATISQPSHDRAVSRACVVHDSCSEQLAAFGSGVRRLAHFQFKAKSFDTVHLLWDLRGAANALGYRVAERVFDGIANAGLLVAVDAPRTAQLKAFNGLVPLAASLGDPRLVQGMKLACFALEEEARSAEHRRELGAQNRAIVAVLERDDMLTEAEQQALEEAKRRVVRSARREARRVARLYHRLIGGPIRLARMPPARTRVRRSARRVRLRTVCRRRQTDSGGSEEGGAGDPPGPPTGLLVEAYRIALLRSRSARSRSSTAGLRSARRGA